MNGVILPDQLRFVDDDGEGFQLQIARSEDGDFWLSIIPREPFFSHKYDEQEQALFNGLFLAAVRVRVPMTGGGMHPALWWSLVKLFRRAAERPDELAEEAIP